MYFHPQKKEIIFCVFFFFTFLKTKTITKMDKNGNPNSIPKIKKKNFFFSTKGKVLKTFIIFANESKCGTNKWIIIERCNIVRQLCHTPFVKKATD